MDSSQTGDASEIDGAAEMDAAEMDAAEMDGSAEMDAAEIDGSAEMDASDTDGAEMDGSSPMDAALSGCEPLILCDNICTATAADLDHCGGCGVECLPRFQAINTCEGGACLQACSPGTGDCDGDLALPQSNGCETDLRYDPANCGECGNACPMGEYCIAPYVCAPQGFRPGENCASAIELSAGLNVEPNRYSFNDHLTTLPSCERYGISNAGDLVMSYTPAVTGYAFLQLQKGFADLFTMMISDAPCGMTTPEHACVSDIGPLELFFPITANTTYSIYVINTDFNVSTLVPNPVSVVVDETDCSASVGSIASLTPQPGTTTPDLFPRLSVTFDVPLNDTGVITLSGNMGFSRSYSLSSSQVSISADRRSLTIDPGQLPAGEQMTVTWSLDSICGGPLPLPSPAWTFAVPTPPCVPGAGGLLGSQTSSISLFSQIVPRFRLFVAADADTDGWIYFGGGGSFERISKDGAAIENLRDPSRAGPFQSGYAALVSGGNVYAVSRTNASTLPASGRVMRITEDGGQTWAVQDMVQWSARAPSDTISGIAEDGGRIYLITQERTPGAGTEIWSFDPNAAVLPAEAGLEGVLYASIGCAGLAIDALNFYTGCYNGPVLRIDRTTLATTELISAVETSINVNSLQGDDFDGDGVFDVLYLQTFLREGYSICDPSGTSYTGTHYRFGNGLSSAYGLSLDPALSVLWAFDWEYSVLWRIE